LATEEHRNDKHPCRLLFPKLNQDFRVAFDAFVKLLISFGRILDPNAMAHNQARFCPVIHNQVAQIFVVFLHWRLPTGNCDSLVEEIGDWEWKHTMLCLLILCPWIGSNIDAD
jgi:hypothetical protein